MRNLNIQNLKNLFLKKQPEPQPEQDSTEESSNPYLNYSIAIRGVSQLELLDEIYMNRSPQEYSVVRNQVKIQQFDFIYKFLLKVPLEKDKDLIDFILNDLGKDEVLLNLNKLMLHFVELEEYEKCANIQKYLQKIEESLSLPVDL